MIIAMFWEPEDNIITNNINSSSKFENFKNDEIERKTDEYLNNEC
jgi:hypothetical protein